MKHQRTLTAQINHDHGRLAAPCFTTHRTDTQYTPLGKKDVAALHLSCRRCKSVYKLGLCGKTVLWRCCKSVHETIASRHVSCIQFSDVSAAQVHSHCQENIAEHSSEHNHTIERYWKSCSIAMCQPVLQRYFNACQHRGWGCSHDGPAHVYYIFSIVWI